MRSRWGAAAHYGAGVTTLNCAVPVVLREEGRILAGAAARAGTC